MTLRALWLVAALAGPAAADEPPAYTLPMPLDMALTMQLNACLETHGIDTHSYNVCMFDAYSDIMHLSEIEQAMNDGAAEPGSQLFKLLFRYYSFGLVAARDADPEEQLRISVDVLGSLGRFDAAALTTFTLFHLFKAEAHAALGDLDGGATTARLTIGIYDREALSSFAKEMIPAEEIDRRVRALEDIYDGRL